MIGKKYKKIMIFGRPGSGKSTFALKLHKATKIPIHHLDKHFFEANWVEREYQEFLDIQQAIVNDDMWIIDGNSTKSLEMRYSKADLVLYFNYPKWLCFYRIFKRLFVKDKELDDRADNCKETVRWSLISYMWGFEERVKKIIRALKGNYPNVKFIEIMNSQDLQEIEHELKIIGVINDAYYREM